MTLDGVGERVDRGGASIFKIQNGTR